MEYFMKKFEEDKHSLNYEKMDSLHKEFLDIYNSVNLMSKDSINQKATELLEHSKKHFAEEEKLMDRYDYPRSKEHKEEHNKVLSELRFFIDKSHTIFGMSILKSYYVEKLPYWFDYHLLSMDSDLAAYLKNFNFKNENKEQEAN
jgi:hemerythrin-like metal-binding protein